MYQEQYHDNNYQKNEQKKQASAGVTTSTTTTTVDTEPGVFRNPDYDKHIILEEYTKTIRQPMTMQVCWFLGKLLEDGMEASVILSAIHETGWAPRPSPQYLRAILLRCKNEGIYTQAQWDYRQAERQEAIEQANAARYSGWISYPGDGRDLPF